MENNNQKIYSYGLFYLNENSKLYKIDDFTYQIKCVHRIFHTGKDTRIVTLEFNSNNLTEKEFEYFNNISRMVEVNLGYTRIKDNLYEINSVSKFKISRPSKYEIKIFNTIQDKLYKMKPQTKPANRE